MAFYENLKKLREQRNISQYELANMVQLNQGTIAKYELNIMAPKPDTIGQIAIKLGVQLGSYNAVSKIHGVSATTVKNVVLKSADFVKKCEQKKEQNTADILSYMEEQKKDVCEVLGICLGELKKFERYKKTPPQQIATTMAILIDKYTAFGGGPKDETVEDELSRSLRELGEELESDD